MIHNLHFWWDQNISYINDQTKNITYIFDRYDTEN